MKPPWGINWQMYHKDREDMPHIERMGYRSFTIYEWMWSDRGFCHDLLSVARTDAIFLNRDHPLSEQKDDLWRNDPAQKGRNHADEWAQKVREGRVYTPLDRTYFLGINEPDSHQFQRQIDAYNESYCRRLAEHGLRGAAYSFGVGHPSTVDLLPTTLPDWSWYEASAAAILEGNHLAAFHEYGAPTPDGHGWGYWCNRLQFCPYPFDAGLDECGIDNGVLQSGILKGYAEFMTAEEYLFWLDDLQTGYAHTEHTRTANLLFYNIFGYDHGSSDSKDWHSFDIRPMRPQLEAFRWTEVLEITPMPDARPLDVYLPSISHPTPKTPTVIVSVPNGANLRSGPSTDHDILGAVIFGTPLSVIGKNEAGDWWQVLSEWGAVWVNAGIVDEYNVEHIPAIRVETRPLATGILDPLVLEAIMQVEAGGRSHSADGLPIIRFEAHVFRNRLHNDARFSEHFRYNEQQGWQDQYWRKSVGDPWRLIHTGNQTEEYAALNFAATLHGSAAYQSISMGIGQVMGFHFARLGYATALEMFRAFARSQPAQVVGMVNFILTDASLVTAINRRDWEGIARGYNGSGNVAEASAKYKTAYEAIRS